MGNYGIGSSVRHNHQGAAMTPPGTLRRNVGPIVLKLTCDMGPS